jgi:hypothetical protein
MGKAASIEGAGEGGERGEVGEEQGERRRWSTKRSCAPGSTIF